MKQHLRARPALIAGFAIASLFTAAFAPESASAQNGYPNAFRPYSYTIGISGAVTTPNTDFIGVGNANGTAGAACLDGTAEYWDVAQRYAGEFSGFRVAAAASLCQGFGTVSEPVGGFDGRTTLGTFVTGGFRVSAPLLVGRQPIAPYVGIGGAYANVKVEAFPFESNRAWRSGWYWEVGVVIPLTPPQPIAGMGTVQSIDAAATELYLAYKRLDVGDQTLSGGAQTSTDIGMFVGGARIRF